MNIEPKFTLQGQAAKMGWQIVKSVVIYGDGVQAPGAVVMSIIERNQEHPYAIHFFNAQDGGFHAGNYCATREEAEEAYTKRALRHLVRFEQFSPEDAERGLTAIADEMISAIAKKMKIISNE